MNAHRLRRILRLALALALSSPAASWASTGGSTLPFIAPLQTVTSTLTGPFAGIVGTAAAVIGACLWVFNSEQPNLARTGKLICGIACLVNIPNLLSALGINAAIF